jgi:hypothetical protein
MDLSENKCEGVPGIRSLTPHPERVLLKLNFKRRRKCFQMNYK